MSYRCPKGRFPDIGLQGLSNIPKHNSPLFCYVIVGLLGITPSETNFSVIFFSKLVGVKIYETLFTIEPTGQRDDISDTSAEITIQIII